MPVSLPEPSPSCPSLLLPKEVIPLDKLFSTSPLGNFLSTEPTSPLGLKFPVDHFPPKLNESSSHSTYHIQEIDSSIQPEAILSLTGSPSGLPTYVSTIKDTDCSSTAISQFSWWQAHDKNMLLPRLPQYDLQQENASLHVLDSYFWGDCDASCTEATHISFFGFKIQELLKRQIKERITFQGLEKKEKEDRPFSEPKWTECQLTASWNSLYSHVGEQGTRAPHTGWDIKGKSEKLGICKTLLYMKTLSGNLEQKYSQLFWGLPSLHSESVVATVLIPRSGYSLEPHLVLFNGICKAPAVQIQDRETPPLPQSHLLPLTNVHPQSFPHMEVRSHTPPLNHIHSQGNMKLPCPIPPLSSRLHKNTFGKPQNGSNFDILDGIQHQEWHVLQKHQESLRGLVPEFHKYQEASCPQAPNFPLGKQSSQVYTPAFTSPGRLHTIIEHQENLETHSPERPIPSWCFQSGSNPGSLMEAQYKSTETSQCNCRLAYSPPSEHEDHKFKDIRNGKLNYPRSSYDTVLKSQLRKDMAKNLGHTLRKCPLDNPLMVSECYVFNSVKTAPETKSEWACHSRNGSGKELSSIFRKNLDHNQMKNFLGFHVSRKYWQISVGRIPIKVCRSWLADNNIPPSGNSHIISENRNLSPRLGRDYCNINTMKLSFLDHKTQEELEDHIIRFRVSQKWGLPLKVLESIKFYILREAKTWPLPHCDFLTSSNHISVVGPKAVVFNPLCRCSKAFQGNEVETTNTVPIMHHPSPVTSLVGKEGQEALRKSHSDTDHEFTETIHTVEDGRQTFLLCTHSVVDKVNQDATVLEKECKPEQPMKQDVAGLESRNEKVSFSHSIEMLQGKRMTDMNSKHLPTSNPPWGILKDCELSALQSQSSATLTTSKLGSSKITNVSKVDTTLTTEHDPPRISIPKEATLSDFNRRLLSELKLKLESGPHSQAEGLLSDTTLSSDSWTSDSSLSYSHSVIRGSVTDFHKLHVHLDGTEISTEQRQEPWVHKQVLYKSQDENLTVIQSKLIPSGYRRENDKSEKSGLETSRAMRNSHLTQERKLEETALPPESRFRKKMRQFFQWLDPRRKNTGQKIPEKDRALIMSCGPPEAHELMAALGKMLEDKMAYRQKLEAQCLSQKKEEIQTQAMPIPGQPSSLRASCNLQRKERSRVCFCKQASVFPCPRCLICVGQIRDRVKPLKKSVSFKE